MLRKIISAFSEDEPLLQIVRLISICTNNNLINTTAMLLPILVFQLYDVSRNDLKQEARASRIVPATDDTVMLKSVDDQQLLVCRHFLWLQHCISLSVIRPLITFYSVQDYDSFRG